MLAAAGEVSTEVDAGGGVPGAADAGKMSTVVDASGGDPGTGCSRGKCLL